jgi:hypothetical protein
MRMLAAMIAVAAVLAGAARAEDLPDRRPMLRIEPGMHTAQMRSIGVDAACTLMVTGSDDKTARLWALPEGGRGAPQLVRTLRVPIGEGNDGKLYAVALSPDGKWVAAGGYDARWSADKTMSVYIFDAMTGRLAARLGRLGNVIYHLAFSPDGRWLAATLGAGGGMRLWETGSWRPIAEDKDYDGKNNHGAAFDAKGTLYTVANDGAIRRFGAGGGLEAKEQTGGTGPYSIAVYPDGAKLAVGFGNGSTTVEVYDSRTLKRLYAADTGGITAGNPGIVAWSADGAWLYSGKDPAGPFNLFIWQDEGRGKRSGVLLSRGSIVQLLPCGDGFAAGADDPAFGLIAGDGAKRFWQEGVTADMRGKKREAFTLSADGARVRFGLGVGDATPVLFDLATFELRNAPEAVPGLAAPRTSGIAVSDWENNLGPKLNGKPIALSTYEFSRAFAIAPDTSRLVLGTEYNLRAYRAEGGGLWQKANPATAWGVNISSDGRLVVAAYGDGTIRWHRLSDGKELLALFVHAKDRRFVAWTPKGYYAASPGAEDLIGWHVNRDWDHASDFFPASRFRDKFNRPDIVKRVLGDLDEETAIAEANRLAGAAPAGEIAKKLPPVITILSPGEDGTFSSDSLTVRYSLRSPSGLTVSEVGALVDGRPLGGGTAKGLAPVSASNDTESSLTLTGLPQRDVTLSLVARAGDLESTPFSIRLKFQGSARASAAPKGSLYALAVGTGIFQDKKVPGLRWAEKDARDFKAALERQQGSLYAKVEVKLLTGEAADRAAIVDGLDWLIRQVGQGGAGDVGVLFLSGHGVTSPIGKYYYVPYNAKMESIEGRLLPARSSAVPDTEITDTLAALKGKALFFFDTCHAGLATASGGLDYNKFVNQIGDAGRAIVLASSAGSEVSVERDDWQHGAFTKALLEGLAGQGHHYKTGVVTIGELNLYVERRVEELTGGKPVELKPRATPDFDFAMVP